MQARILRADSDHRYLCSDSLASGSLTGSQYPLQIGVRGNAALDDKIIRKNVVKKLKSSENFSARTFPIKNLWYEQADCSLSCSSDSGSSQSCVFVTITFFNASKDFVLDYQREVEQLVKAALEECAPGYNVVRIPSKFDPSLLVVEEEIIRKIEQIAFRKFEAFEERLFKKVESLVGPLQSKL